MRARTLIIAALVALLPAIPAAAPALIGDGAHGGSSLVDKLGVRDDWKLSFARSEAEATLEVRKSDNIELVGRLNLPGTTDMQFQRRTGDDLVLDGAPYEGDHLDIAVAGGMSGPDGTGNGGLYVLDVTDPTNPVQLAGFACGGFHADVAIYENLAILGHDGGAGACEPPHSTLPKEQEISARSPGVGIFDITDPANPVFVRHFSNFKGEAPRGPHNISVNPEAGLLYFSFQSLGSTPYFGYFDLNDLSSSPVYWPMRSIDSEITAGDSCHDIGLGFDVTDALGNTRDLLFCAAVTATYIWDIGDPTTPTPVGKIFNPGVNIHHGARLAADGKTLVVNDELAGAAAAAGCNGGAPTGAQWFYDISVPEAPVLIDAIATSELNTASMPCTSHFYNFLPSSDGSQALVTGWYRSGVVVHDFSDHPQPATEVAYYDEDGAVFWAAYAWRGHIYGTSYATDPTVGGIYVLKLEGLEDLPPTVHDEGTSWSRWGGAADEGTS